VVTALVREEASKVLAATCATPDFWSGEAPAQTSGLGM